MPVSGPDKCPECGRAPLVPLSPGQCPECGFEYDEHTLIWRPRRPWRIYVVFANVLVFSPWLFRFFEVVLLARQWPSKPVMLGAAIALVSLCWALPRIRVLLSEGHRYAAVTPRGIHARTPRDVCLIPYGDVREVSVLFGVPHIRRLSRRRACQLDWIFDSDAEVQGFIAAVAAARQRYLHTAGAQAEP